MPEPIRVLIVDDSPLARKILTDILQAEPDIQVPATAATAEIALRKIEIVKPDVITMDMEMPGMGGLAAISEIMAQRPTPILVLSAFAQRGAELTMQALERGAVDFIPKPNASMSGGIPAIAAILVEKVRQAGRINIGAIAKDHPPAASEPQEDKAAVLRPFVRNASFDVVAIGASTGGPPALKTVLSGLPGDFPVGIVVVQHMPPVFTKAFAERLDTQCAIRVKEAATGDQILPGRALIAPGDFHLTVSQNGGAPVVALDQSEQVSGHRPSVDVLMHSVAREIGRRAVVVIMTGMGKDGADGIAALKARGAPVIAQDKDSSVIFGMNREVIMAGNADDVLPITSIAGRLCQMTGVAVRAIPVKGGAA